MEPIKRQALHLLRKRVSVIPVGIDKRPLTAWKQYQTELMTEAEADRLFTKSPGLAVVCGAVSQGLEVMDFDLKHDKSGTLWQTYTDTIKVANPDLWDAVSSGIVRTKNNGYHIYYCCENPDGNKVLARNPDQTVLIETRGEGGYVVAPPSPGYEQIGDGELKELTTAERDYLHEVARRFNEPAKEFPPVPAPSSDITPWDDFNSRVSCMDILTDSGWTVTKRDGDRVYLKRPGESDADHSGNYHEGHGMFYCHSTSTRLPRGEGLTPYALLTHLHYNGDFKESAKDLRSKGYGSTSTTRVPVPAPEHHSANPDSPDELLVKLKSCEVTTFMTITKPVPFLTIQGKTISTNGNLTSLVGMTKSGKTAVNQAGISGSLNREGRIIDTVGMNIVPSMGKLILHIDSEQSLFDHYRGLQSILKRSGMETQPEYFKSYNTTGKSPSEAIQLLLYALEFYGSRFGGVHSIWLDGPADFVNSVNDEKEVNALVTLLMMTARKYQCPIINTIHFNPNQDSKGRGHLGSALERKSESVLSITKNEDGLSKYEPLKGLLRNADGFNPVTFQYCPEHGYHVSRGEIMSSKSKKEQERRELLCDMWHLFDGGKRFMTSTNLADELATFYDIRKDSAKKKMARLITAGVLERNYDLKKPIYRLNGGMVAGGGFAIDCH